MLHNVVAVTVVLLLGVTEEGRASQSYPVDLEVDQLRTVLAPERTLAVQHDNGEEAILRKRAGLDVTDVELEQALAALHEASGIALLFSPTLFPPVKVSCACADLSVQDALATLLGPTGLNYHVSGDQVVISRLGPGDLPPIPSRPQNVKPAPLSLSPIIGTDAISPTIPLLPVVGQVTGRVVDSRTGEPLGAAQVYIADLDVGVLTQQNGRYLLLNVPAGTHSLTATRIGYRSVTQEVSVADGGTVTADFQLAQEALQLDEVIVTGTPRGTQRRAIGNVVGRVDASEVTQVAPIASMQQLLSGREPGLSFNGSDGIIGSGRAIRIRGVASFNMSQQPLIYVDGVRVDNDPTAGPEHIRATAVSRLNDFNPNDIESIEIIKGPAAATLYGTEASAGVIQIITKKGRTGAPQFDLMVSQGVNWLQGAEWKVGDAWGRDPDTGELISFNIIETEKAAGRPVFTSGRLQTYNLSMRGGTDVVRYFLSTDYQDNSGMVDYNWDKRLSLRSNVGVVANEDFSLDLSAGYLNGRTSFMQQYDRFDPWYAVKMATPTTLNTRDRGFFRAPPEVSREISSTRGYQRFTGSLSLRHTPAEWFTQRLVLGVDQTNDENVTLVPRQAEPEGHWFGGRAYGEKYVELPTTSTYTVDFSGSLLYRPWTTTGFTTSVGFQYYRFERESRRSEGRIFPSPAITSLSGAAEIFTTESFEENASLGMYVQEELNWRDRVFLTAAVRADDNSAFGAEYDAAIYPKFSATWVVTDEDFWPVDWVNSLRLRTAWGKAGRQPSTFAAVTLYEPDVGVDGSSAVRPATYGNPDLGPEVSSELEVGFDLALLDDRLSMEFTHYRQKVRDALVDIPVASSGGFSGSQSANLGQVSNWGYEVRLDARLLDHPSYAFDLGVSYSFNDNRVDDLGGVPETDTVQEGWHFPSAFYVTPILDSGDFDAFGRPENIMCDSGVNVVDGFGERGGPPMLCEDGAPRLYWGPLGHPKHEGNVDASLTIGDNLRFYAMAEWQGYNRVEGNESLCRFYCYPNDRFAIERAVPALVACAIDSGGPCGGGDGSRTIHGANAAFAKLREVSMTYTLPESFVARAGLSRASVTIAGRDLYTWQAQKCIPEHVPGYPPCYGGTTLQDPEIRDPRESLDGGNSNSCGVSCVPGLSSVGVTFRVTF